MPDKPSKLCFIVGPIGAKDSPERKRSDKVRRFIIEPAMAHLPDFKLIRADQIGKPGMIDKQIISNLKDADLVIADLASSNPNAFYEIGIRHVMAKPTVHMQDAGERIPFDISLYSSVLYSMESVEEIDSAVAELKKHINDAIDPNHEIDNPVTRTLGHEQFSPKALPESELLRAELASLREQLAPILREREITADMRRQMIITALANREAGPTGPLSEFGKSFQGTGTTSEPILMQSITPAGAS
jgi:hypothetical protein